MRLMLSFSLGENQDVINIDNNKLSDIRMKNIIYNRLEAYLRCFVSSTLNDWDILLSRAEFAHNNAFHESVRGHAVF
jgi:hypothetical protein